MKMDKEKYWQPYLDGELSVSETSAFEEDLSAEERERLAAELRFENALAERLSDDAACPDDVWKRTQLLLSQGQSPRRSAYRRWLLGAATLAAAAAVAFFISISAPLDRSPSPAVVMAAHTVEELASLSETEPGREPVEAYLVRHNIRLSLRSLVALKMHENHKHIQLMGAGTELANGEYVVEMLFACCRLPVKVLVAKVGSIAAQEIGRVAGTDEGQVVATRVVGGYLAAVVSDHPAHGLLDIFVQDEGGMAHH